LKDVTEEKDVGKEITIVILLQILNVKKFPSVLRPFIVFGGERFVLQGVVKIFDGW